MIYNFKENKFNIKTNFFKIGPFLKTFKEGNIGNKMNLILSLTCEFNYLLTESKSKTIIEFNYSRYLVSNNL